jgi:uncharacterized membrane protein YjjP (DUF1212 family)
LNLATEVLAHAGRLLLEYNESTREIHRTLERTSKALTGEKCDAIVSYGGVAVSLTGNGPVLMPIRELRYNAALQARVHSILDHVCRGELKPSKALEDLKCVEANTAKHPRWLVALLLGLAGACLAVLLGADTGAVIVAGLSTSLGLVARQQLGQRNFNLLSLPLAAGFIGAFLGGLTMRFGWTQTPGLALIVPSLMIVPGPHLINGLFDLVDNYVPMSLARLGLATSILAACGLGIVIGMELTLPALPLVDQVVSSDHLNLFSDIILAGIVTIGFAVFYNTAWPQVGLTAVGGMIGHGLRYLALEAGCRLEGATFLGALVVGIVSARIARSNKVPVAVISFAGAVTMMPGVQIYRAFGGSLQLARLQNAAEPTTVAGTLGYASQACLVVAALALGLVVAARIATMLAGKEEINQSV